jgi:UDP-glucose 4-epimerase
MDIIGKRFLVTGGSGFIGSAVVRELLKHDIKEVLIYDNFSRGSIEKIENSLNDDRCKIFQDGGDIRDVDLLDKAMENIDGVFHLAAMWLLHCRDYPQTAFKVNIEGTFNILQACVKNNINRLVFSSSASVYGDAVEMPMTETHPFNNRNFYGSTKIAGEAMCRAYYDRYNLNYVGLRYMNVYGPGQDQNAAYSGVIPIMLNHIEKGKEPLINGDGSQAYDFIYVDDAARCNILAMQNIKVDEFYNVGTEVKTSISELCSVIKKIKKSDIKVNYNPYDQNDVRQFVQNRIGSNKKAYEDLGFSFKYDLKTGLKKLIKWRSLQKINSKV